MAYKSIQIIINPASGQNAPILNTLNTVLKDHDLAWDVSITQKLGDGQRYAEDAIKAGADLVVSYGGDGTVMDVANGLIGGDVPLLILPGGTGNALAAELNIPTQLDAAARLMVDAGVKVRHIDVGDLKERKRFLLRAGFGFTADMIDNTSREMKDRYGFIAYVMGGLEALRAMKPVTYHLEMDGETVEMEAVACMLLNMGTFGTVARMKLSQRITLDDGLLDVMLLDSSAVSAMSLAASIAGVEDAISSLAHWQVKHVRVEIDEPQVIHIDGEAFEATDSLDVEIMPGVLPVLVKG